MDRFALALLACILGCACGPGSDDAEEATNSVSPSEPVQSIPFCQWPEVPQSEPAASTVDFQARASDAMAAVETQFSSEDFWHGWYFDPASNVVVQLTTEDESTRSLIRNEVDFSISFERVGFSAEEIDDAHDALLAAMDPNLYPESPLTGIGKGGLSGRVEISLQSFDSIDTLISDWEIPEPHAIYCIMPTEDPRP